MSLELLGQLGSSTTTQTWLTGVWLVSLGVTIGLAIVLVLFLLGWILSKVPGLNKMFENRVSRYIVAALITAGLLALAYPLFSFAYELFLEGRNPTKALAQLIGFTTPILFLSVLGLLALTSQRLMSEAGTLLSTGPLFWFLTICASFAVLCVTGIFLSKFDVGLEIVDEPELVYDSITDYPQHMFPRLYKIEAVKENGAGVEIPFGLAEDQMDAVSFRSGEALQINYRPFDPLDDVTQFGRAIEGQNQRQVYKCGDLIDLIFVQDGKKKFEEVIDTLYVKNLGREDTTLRMWIQTKPAFLQVRTVYFTVIIAVVIFLLYILQRASMPKISAIALSTFKTEVSQPLFMLLLAVGTVLLIAFVYIPGNTFGEDIKLLKDSGLTIILVAAIFMAVFAASKSVAEEIEGRTALTVLSKPVGRRQFILGKFFGIAWSVMLMYAVLGIVLAASVAYKPIYDARETSRTEIEWVLCHQEMLRIIPGLVLGYMEVLVFVAISIVISTRLPIMANLMICFAIYVMGHLTPLMVQSSVAVEAFEPVIFIGQLIAVVLPVLDHFNIQAAVSGETDVPLDYLGWSALYCMIYGTIALLVALIFFEDRDLA